MGWDPTQGLGVAGDGMKTSIAVAQKLDQLGIGANRPGGPEAIAWKQNNEFEDVLARLNASGSKSADGTEEIKAEPPTGLYVDNSGDISERGEKERKSKKEKKSKREKVKAESSGEESKGADEKPPVIAAPTAAPHRAYAQCISTAMPSH